MTLATQLEKIESSGLIRLAQVDPELEYMFRHALVQDATYESLLKADRRSLHHAVGQTLESLYAGRLDEIAATLALHFEKAEEYEKAVHYLTRAGESAARVYAVDEAIELFGHALELVPTSFSEDDLIHLYSQYGRVLELAGRFDVAIEIYNRMRTEAVRQKNPRMELVALMARSIIHSTPTPLHDTNLAKDLSERALAIASELGDPEAQSRIYWILMLAFLFDGRIQESISYGEQSLEIARAIDNPERLAFTLNDLSRCYGAAGLLEKASAANLEARLLWEKLGNIPMLVDNLNTYAVQLLMGGKLEEGLALVTQAYNTAHSIHNAWGQAFSLMITAMISSKLGDVIRTVQAGEELFLLDPGQTFPPSQIAMRAILSDLYLELGQIEKAYKVVHEISESTKGLKSGYKPPILASWARLELVSGNLMEAKKLLDQALENYDPENFITFSPLFVTFAQYEIYTAQGDHLEALACLDKYIGVLYGKRVIFSLPEHLLAKAQALVALKRKDEAIVVLKEVASTYTPLNFRRSLWKVYALLSELELESGDPAGADKSRRKAREYLDFLLDHTPADLHESFLQLPAVAALLKTS